MKKIFSILIILALTGISTFCFGQERIFFLKGTSAPFSIYSSNLDGSNELLIKTGVSNGGKCAIKSGKIYYMSGSSINRINLDGTGQTVIPNTSDAYGDINISPGGDKLVYAGGVSNFQMFIIDTNGMNKTLWNNGQPNSIHQTAASWNTAGTIYFVLSNYGNAYSQKIYSKPVNDPAALPTQLTTSFGQEPNSGGPYNLVIYNDQPGNLITMNPDGSNPVVLSTAGVVSHARGTWHLSDSTFYYMHNSNIWKIKYNNTGNTQITTTAGFERVIGIADTGPAITITASANPVCQGDTVTFTAHGLSALPAGTLQWYVNGLPVSAGGNLSNGLVAHYPFDDNLSDATGHCQNAVMYGNVSPATDRWGNVNHAFYIGGNSSGSDYLTVAHNSALAVQNPFSVSVWINKEAHGGWIINKGRDIVNGYGIVDAGCGAAVVYGVNNGAGINNTTVSLNQWHLYTGVFNGDSASFYLDGVLADKQRIASNSYVSTSNDYPLAIGRHFTNCCYNTNPPYYSYPFKGKVDDFRLYNRALTPHEAWLLYHGFDTTFSYVPQNGDVVYCVYTSTGTPVVTDTSNYITMTVNALPADIGQSTGLQPSLQSGLVAYYPFNGNANDESGNGINCINYGALLTSDRFGNANSAYIFDGLNDYLGSGSNTLFENADNHALVAWFKSTKKGSPQGIAAYTDNGDAGYTLYMTELDSIGIVNGTGYPNYCVAVANQSFTNDTTWHFLATSRNNGISSLFLDGVLQFETCNHLITFNGCRMFIGQTGFFFGQFFGGKIDNVRFYNRALTAEEIACLYTGNCLTLTADLTADSICVGNNTSLNIQNSQSGIKYQMLKNAVNYGTFQIGNGNTLTFPISGLAQTSTFTIHATNTTTGCNIMLDSTFTVYVGQMVNAIVSPNDTVCSGISTTLTASGGTGYTWSNGMTTAAITVSPLATTVYHVTVTNNSGCADTDSVMVSVNQRPVPTIAGPTAICLGTNNATYTTQTGMSGYTWTVSPGGTITSGSATNTITVTWNTLGAQTVNVNYANSFGCTASAPVSMTVTVNPMVAPTLTGVTNLCVNSGYYFYSTEPGMNNYVWSVSSGATIIWGNGTKELMVSWDVPGTQWISVNYSNSSGCTASTPTQLNITVNPLPSSAGTVSGAETVCAGTSGVSYSTTPIPDAVTYVWSLPQGATIASGAGTASILVNFGSSAQPGDVTVYGNNLCGNGAVSLPLHVNVAALPGNAGVPAGAEVVCQGDSGVIYYVSPIFNAVFYIWDITGGGVITAGNGTNSIQAKFPTGPANCSVTVYGANSCGAGVISPVLNVIVNLLPPAPVITQNGSELVSSAPAGNQWYFNGTLIPGANQPTFIPEHSGIYSVRITLEGCISDMSNEIDYIMTGIGSSEPFSVKVYPVPNNGQFSVYLNSGKKERVTLSVWNGLGEKVFELQGIEFTGNRQQPIDLTPRPAGIYTLVVDGENLWVVRKVVVE